MKRAGLATASSGVAQLVDEYGDDDDLSSNSDAGDQNFAEQDLDDYENPIEAFHRGVQSYTNFSDMPT